MIFEVDERLTPTRAKEILQACRFDEFEDSRWGFDAFHAESGTNVYFAGDEASTPVRAEGLAPPAWARRSCIMFRYSTEDHAASESLTMEFAKALAGASPAYFVLSFQFEHVYVVRDAKGLREIADPSMTMQIPVK